MTAPCARRSGVTAANRRKGLTRPIAAAAALLVAHAMATAASLTGMGTTPTQDFTVTRLSDSGLAYGLGGLFQAPFSPAASASYSNAYAWNAGQYLLLVDTAASGMLKGGVAAVSATGLAVGWADSPRGAQAAIWGTGGASLLSPLPGISSFATAVSADGAVIAGVANTGLGLSAAFVSGPAPGTASTYPGSGTSAVFMPLGVSANGSAVVGLSDLGFASGNAAGRVSPIAINTIFSLAIPDLPGASGSVAVAASNPSFQGSTDFAIAVAGYGQQAGRQQAFVLNKDFGTAPNISWLDMLGSDTFSRAADIALDGRTVVGTSGTDSGTSRPFIWTASAGIQDLSALLTTRGANLTGWQLQSATALSSSGEYVAGLGLHNGQRETWIAQLTPSAARALYSAPGSSFEFGNAGDWRDAAGNTLFVPPGPTDDYFLSTGQAILRVNLALGTHPVVRSVEFGRGAYSAFGGSLTATGTLTVKGGLFLQGLTTITADRLIATGFVGGDKGLLSLGAVNQGVGPVVTLQSAEVQQDGRVQQFYPSAVNVAGKLSVAGRYELIEGGGNGGGGPATLVAERIEVLANCDANHVCATPGTFVTRGRVTASSIVNGGDFTVGAGYQAAVIVRSGALDAFLNTGTLTIHADGGFGNRTLTWSGNVTNAATGTVKTYGVTQGAHAPSVDWGSGTFTNHGAYDSDPVVNIFGTLVVGDDGYITGGAGDAFQVRGNFTSSSHSALWDVSRSTLAFVGTGQHTYSASGNSHWGVLQLDPGVKLSLKALGSGPVSFSFAALSGFSSLADLQDRFSADTGITIQVVSITGGWAGAGTITLPGGGTLLSAVPEPATAVLWLAGLGWIGQRGRRRHAA